MTLNKDSIIKKCVGADEQGVPQIKYEFISISQIAEMPSNSIVGE